MDGKEDNLTENHTTPKFQEIHTKQLINEENSSLSGICRQTKAMVETQD